jgi:hypothetical protein
MRAPDRTRSGRVHRDEENTMQQEAMRKGEAAHLRIVVAEGKVTLDDLHAALERAIKEVVKGGCNCGLTGFDLSFVRGDPHLSGLAELTQIPNIQGGILTRG